VRLAIVMLDPSLRIRRFTPAAEKMLNLIPADIGRPLTDLNLNVAIPDLQRHLDEVIDKASDKEFDVRDREGRWCSLRLRPYRSVDNKIDGAVVVLIDIDTAKRNQATMNRQAELLEQVREPILMWELGGTIVYWNGAAEAVYGYTREQALARRAHELLATSPSLEEFSDELKKEARWRGNLVHTRSDGQKLTVDSRMVLVREADGRNLVIEANRIS
jgi:two-component system CheB/CheR fusion protein